MLNRSNSEQRVVIEWTRYDLKDDLVGRNAEFATVRYDVRDLWAKKAVGDTSKPITLKIGPRDAAVYRLTQR